jgi:hypothetical protein
MRLKNSALVWLFSLKEPSRQEVVISDPCFSTPLIIMQRWRA